MSICSRRWRVALCRYSATVAATVVATVVVVATATVVATVVVTVVATPGATAVTTQWSHHPPHYNHGRSRNTPAVAHARSYR